jgi:uncharacterized protein (TIGR04255 family)
MPAPPTKLKYDAIVEALLEIQFEHSHTAEVIVGSLASSKQWRGYAHSRLPIAELPVGIRDADPDLRFQPILQLSRPIPGEVVKVGPRSLSLHVLRPYPGWTDFLPRLEGAIAALFDALPAPIIHRVGLRYVNALTPAHGFPTLWDLNFEFSVAGDRPTGDLAVGYTFDAGTNKRIQVKLASPAFVVGPTVADAVAFVDVDVITAAPLGLTDKRKLRAWIVEAHKFEKDAFFDLWPTNILDAMTEK